MKIVTLMHFNILHNHVLSCYKLTDPNQAIVDSNIDQLDHGDCYRDVITFHGGGCNVGMYKKLIVICIWSWVHTWAFD